MGFKVKVRFQSIDRLAQSLGSMPDAIARAARAMGQETLQLIDEGFAKGQSPDGAPWAAKKRPDGRRVLHGASGRLRGGNRLIPLRRGFIVRNQTPYASFHMTGTGRHVARPFYPSRGRVPSTWRPRWVRIIKRELLRGMFR